LAKINTGYFLENASMGKNKTETEPRQIESELSRCTGGNEDRAEIGRRLQALEKGLDDMRKSHIERHQIFTSLIFGSVAILLTVLGLISKSDVHEAIRDMKADARDSAKDIESKVDKATSEMERKFAALSEEALKKPALQISCARGPLDGQQFETSVNQPFPIEPLYLKNSGNKRTDPLSIRLFLSADASSPSGSLLRTMTNDKDYPFSYYVSSSWMPGSGISIAPDETWTLQDGGLDGIRSAATNLLSCKLQIFYGADKPAEARFLLKFK
jgi:hypothetical protein